MQNKIVKLTKMEITGGCVCEGDGADQLQTKKVHPYFGKGVPPIKGHRVRVSLCDTLRRFATLSGLCFLSVIRMSETPTTTTSQKKYRNTPPICIAIRLRFVLQYFRCPYALRKGKSVSTPPICIAVHLPFVSQYASHLYRNAFASRSLRNVSQEKQHFWTIFLAAPNAPPHPASAFFLFVCRLAVSEQRGCCRKVSRRDNLSTTVPRT